MIIPYHITYKESIVIYVYYRVVSKHNNNLANLVSMVITTAGAPYSLKLTNEHVYILTALSSNSNYQCAYLLVRALSAVSYVIPLKTATNVTVEVNGADFVITSLNYNTRFSLIDISGLVLFS